MRIREYFFFGIFAISLALAFFIVWPYFAGLVIALTFSIIAHPFYKRVVKFCRGNKGLAAFLTILLILIVVITPIVLLGIQVFGEAASAYSRLSSGGPIEFIPRLVSLDKYTYISSYAQDISKNLNDYIQQVILWLVQNLGSVFSSIAKITVNVFVGIFALYYFLKDGEKLRGLIVDKSPLSSEHTQQIFKKMTIAVNSVISGTLFIALIQGVVAGIGFFVLGVPQPALWGIITVVTALVPFIGTTLTIFPAAVYLFFANSPLSALGMLLWGIFMVGTIDNFLKPKLIERYVKIHPFLILISVLGGINFFGPLGFLLGPLTLSFLFALFDIYPSFVGEG